MNYDILGCPFCHDGEITVKVFGGNWQEKRGARTSLGKTIRVSKSSITYVVLNGCDKCGKTIEEIERKIK